MVADLVIIVALVFSTVIGYRNGLIRTLFKFVGFVAGGVLGIYLSLKFSHEWSLDVKRIGFVITAIVAGGYLCSFLGAQLAKGLRAQSSVARSHSWIQSQVRCLKLHVPLSRST